MKNNYIVKIEQLLKDSEARYKTVVETSPDCVKLFDLGGNLIFINQGGLKEHGLKNLKEAKKWNFWSSVVEDDRDKLRAAFARAANGKAGTLEVRHTPEGSDREVCLLTLSPVKNEKGETISVFGVSRDISEIKKIDQAKTEFLAIASHQLRTPLTSTTLAIDTILRGAAGKVSRVQRKYLGEACRDLKTMASMINRLLNISRIEMGTFAIEPEPVELDKFLNDIVTEMMPQIRQKEMKVEKNYDPARSERISIDKELMRNVLRNLLANAIKYTQKGGMIRISAQKRLSDIVISVADNGPGIPGNLRSKIFTKMFRAHDMLGPGHEAVGSGMGLYIAKSFMESAGGRIWFKSSADKGTTFFVSVPSGGMKKRDGALYNA